MQKGMPAYQEIVDAFGVEILAASGEIDRQALGAIVFANSGRLQQLEGIVHPAVFAAAQDILATSTKPIAVLEAIKLLESRRLVILCREIWVVTSRLDNQMARLMGSRGMSQSNANARLAAQSSQDEKVRQATRVIVNDGSLAELYAQLDVLWEDLLAKYSTELVGL
jgi:dephospho-CoA kinase